MSEQSTFTPLPEGTKVRITRTINDGNFRVYAGTECVIEDYISAEQGPGVAYYDGSTPGNYGDIAVPADAVELVMTAEAMTARHLLRGYDDEGFPVEDADYSAALPHLTPEPKSVSVEELAAFLAEMGHAPLSAHDPRDGSCVSCPWPRYEQPPESTASDLLARFNITPKETDR